MATIQVSEISPCRAKVRFVLFKYNVITAHDSHFSGGKHAFLSLATTLAAEGFEVHLVSIASREKVLVYAGMNGVLPHLGLAKPGIVTWVEQGVHHHVILRVSDEASGGGVAKLNAARLATAVPSYIRSLVQPSIAALHDDSRSNHDNGMSMGPLTVTDFPSQGPLVTNPQTKRGDDGASASALSGNWVIIDADESQQLLRHISNSPALSPSPPSPAPSVVRNEDDYTNSSTISGSGAVLQALATATLFESIVAVAPPRRCLSYVQNVHFLPLGTSGTGPRHAGLLAAWSRLGAVLAVSEFIASYIRENWSDTAATVPLPLPPVRVVPLAGGRVFGQPPFPDLAEQARPLLAAWRKAQWWRLQPPSGHKTPTSALASQPEVPPEPPPEAARGAVQAAATAVAALRPQSAVREESPVVDVAVLKLTPEKGASIVVELARRLAGRVRFRVVCGDPAAAAVLQPLLRPQSAHAPGTNGTGSCGDHKAIAAADPADATAAGAEAIAAAVTGVPATAPVEMWEPQPHIDRVLEGCVAVLAPSLWLESWGMVVTEALLRGLPVLLSDLGGLPEAGMGMCPAVSVTPIHIPLDRDGVPDWGARTYPKQDIHAWERALLALLLGGCGDGFDCTAAGGDEIPPCSHRSGADSEGDGGKRGGGVRVGGRNGEQCAGAIRDELWDAAAVGKGLCAGTGRDMWERVSMAGRRAAEAHVLRGSVFLREFLDWLAGL